MISLPTEIWTQIFQNFCIHCQQHKHSDNLPDFRLPCAREGKADLKSLCLVSRGCRAISQDILFHYFYNLSDGVSWDQEAPVKDLAPRMLRTLVSNSRLAQQVRMMGLYDHYTSGFDGITRQDLQSWTEVSRGFLINIPDEVTLALESSGDGEDSVLFFDQPGPVAPLRYVEDPGEVRDMFYRWVYYLLVSLTPQLTHLQLDEPLGAFEGEFEDVQDLTQTCPNLRTLTYSFFDGDIKLIVHSLAHFSHVSSFDFYQHWLLQDHIAEPISSGPTLNIRKLSICCWPNMLSTFLRFCPHLEDLEFHTAPWNPWGDPQRVLEWPARIKANLRRLAWSNQISREELANEELDPLVVPLMDFGRLEILEIDQSSLLLYAWSRTGETKRYLLPQTLRILHVAYAQDVSTFDQISDNLRELAAAKATLHPRLSIVKIDHDPHSLSEKEALPEFMNRSGVVSCLQKAGIDLRFGLEEPYQLHDSRRILPAPRGCANIGGPTAPRITHQREVFSLEDLELL